MDLRKYVQYIQNANFAQSKIIHFDDDWLPVGQSIRTSLISRGLAFEDEDLIMLTTNGRELIGISTKGELK